DADHGLPVVLLVDDLVDLPAVVAGDDQGDHQDGDDEAHASAGEGAQDDESAADASGELDGLGVLAHGGLALGDRVVSVGAEGHGASSSIAFLVLWPGCSSGRRGAWEKF